jgi:hypothetical protein
MDFRLRVILWIPTLAYAAFLWLGGKNFSSLGQVVTAAFLGALLGFLLATMFTIRQLRRQKRIRPLGSFEPFD